MESYLNCGATTILITLIFHHKVSFSFSHLSKFNFVFWRSGSMFDNIISSRFGFNLIPNYFTPEGIHLKLNDVT